MADNFQDLSPSKSASTMRHGFDLTTPAGLLLGLVAMAATITVEGGQLIGFINVPAAIIVFGGTAAATLVSFPLATLVNFPRLVVKTMQPAAMGGPTLVTLFVSLAEKARREGLLALEEPAEQLDDDFLRKGITLVIDGTDPETVRSILEIDLSVLSERHADGCRMLEAMGGFAPTWGIIGTVLGLVNVLGNLEDPSGLGAAIAVAFIATLYGVSSANLLWLPIATKLRRKSEQELFARQLMLEGILSIQAGENPRIVREKLEGFLAPRTRGTKEVAQPGDRLVGANVGA